MISFFVVDVTCTFARIIALTPGGIKDTYYLTLTFDAYSFAINTKHIITKYVDLQTFFKEITHKINTFVDFMGNSAYLAKY